MIYDINTNKSNHKNDINEDAKYSILKGKCIRTALLNGPLGTSLLTAEHTMLDTHFEVNKIYRDPILVPPNADRMFQV